MKKLSILVAMLAVSTLSLTAQANKAQPAATTAQAEAPLAMWVDGKQIASGATIKATAKTVVAVKVAQGVNVHVVKSELVDPSGKVKTVDLDAAKAKVHADLLDASKDSAAKTAGTMGIIAVAKLGDINVPALKAAPVGLKWTLTVVSEKDGVVSAPSTVTIIKG
jgi:hypothetical protein